MFLSEQLQKKWKPILEHPDLPEIKDAYRRSVTAMVLENQQKAMTEERQGLYEAAPENKTGGNVDNYDPILISLIRRAVPQLIAYDVAGVQPMTGPTGLIFAMKARYASQTGTEALFDEADSDFAGEDAASNTGSATAHTGTAIAADTGSSANFLTGTGMTAAEGETLGDGTDEFAEMAFSIDKVTVTAKTRALKAEYTMELAQDLKAVHGLDAETELANILSSEILAEINREVIRTIYLQAKAGAQINTTTAGTFDLDTDSNGRWSVEKFKGLIMSIERDANAVGQQTRRGKGNIIVCSSDVASALAMAGQLDYNQALQGVNADETTTTFAGVLNGRFKVYVDPYINNVTAGQFYVVGYRGSSPFDAGIFYCPYVPLQMVRAVGEDSFQPKIGFKTRYGMVQNPFATTDGDGTFDLDGTTASGDQNSYYRRALVTNLM
jgi:hypothetical protein